MYLFLSIIAQQIHFLKNRRSREHINCYASGLLQVNFTSFTIAVACFVFSVQIVLHRLNYTLL